MKIQFHHLQLLKKRKNPRKRLKNYVHILEKMVRSVIKNLNRVMLIGFTVENIKEMLKMNKSRKKMKNRIQN